MTITVLILFAFIPFKRGQQKGKTQAGEGDERCQIRNRSESCYYPGILYIIQVPEIILSKEFFTYVTLVFLPYHYPRQNSFDIPVSSGAGQYAPKIE